jgi:septin family protein
LKTVKAETNGRDSKITKTDFRKKDCFLEDTPKVLSDLKKLRLSMVRDELDELVKMTREPYYQQLISMLLTDNFVAIGPIAAEVLRRSASEGNSISESVPSLKIALKDRYAKYNSAAALAVHYRNTNDQEGLSGLLTNKDQQIQIAAMVVIADSQKYDG